MLQSTGPVYYPQTSAASSVSYITIHRSHCPLLTKTLENMLLFDYWAVFSASFLLVEMWGSTVLVKPLTVSVSFLLRLVLSSELYGFSIYLMQVNSICQSHTYNSFLDLPLYLIRFFGSIRLLWDSSLCFLEGLHKGMTPLPQFGLCHQVIRNVHVFDLIFALELNLNLRIFCWL